MTSFVDRRFRTACAALTLAAASVGLSGCNRTDQADRSAAALALPDLPATLPLEPGPPQPLIYAPEASALPASAPLPLARIADQSEYYGYADDAMGYWEALGDAPPDYAFEYDGVDPWAWQAYDDSMVFAEPFDDGYRYYYYRAGYDEPYFIVDPYWAYGYDDGRLAVVYDRYGHVLPYAQYGPRLDYASRYYVRGVDLHRASRVRRPVIAGDWLARRAYFESDRRDWREARARQAAWQAYHDRVAPRQDSYWREERARRRADAVRFAAWRAEDFRSPPPPRAIPADWRRARWARDDSRFAAPAPGFAAGPAAERRAIAVERQRLADLGRRARLDPPAGRGQREAFADRRGLQEFARAQRGAERPQAAVARTEERRERQAERLSARQARIEGDRQQRAERRDLRQAARAQRTDAVAPPPRPTRQRALAEAQQRRQQAQGRGQERQRVRAEAQDRRPQADARVQARQRVENRREEAQAQAQARRDQAEARSRARQQTEARPQARRDRVEARVEARGQARAAADARRQQARAEAADRRPQAEARAQATARPRAEAQQRRQARPEAAQRAEARPPRLAQGGSERAARRERPQRNQ